MGKRSCTYLRCSISDHLSADSYRHGLKEENQDRASLSQNGLVPNFRNQEFSALIHNRTLSNRQKELLLDWVDVLFEDLQGTPPNRGACLDGIAVIIERSAYLFCQLLVPELTPIETKAGS